MTRDDDFIGQLEGYLDEYEGMTPLPDPVRKAVRAQLPRMRQIRPLSGPIRYVRVISKPAQFAVAAVAVIAAALLGYNLLGGSNGVGPPVPTPTQSPIPTPISSESMPPARSVTNTPFGPGGFGICPPVPSDCTEDPRDDSFAFTYDAPEGWESLPGPGGAPSGVMLEGGTAPDGAAMIIYRGNWLYSDPCRPDDLLRPDIPVGPTVDDFATALDSHPLLNVTSPVDITLAGYSGKYTELQVPSDISGCVRYRPVEDTIYAQGPGNRWHLWILDVEGIRVVIETIDYVGTSAQRQADLQAIVESIEIQP